MVKTFTSTGLDGTHTRTSTRKNAAFAVFANYPGAGVGLVSVHSTRALADKFASRLAQSLCGGLPVEVVAAE